MTTQLEAGPRPVRTYGGWRRTRGIGLFGVGPISTLIVLASVILPLLLAAVSLPLGAASAVPSALVVALTLTRAGGVTIGHLALRRLRWTWGVSRGWTAYRATTIDQHPRAWDLPGVLAPSGGVIQAMVASSRRHWAAVRAVS